jgi:hypothetical protein
MTTDPSTDAVTPPRGGWRGWLARLGFAVQVLIIGAVAIGGIPMFALMVAGAVDEQLLTSTGVRTQAMVIDHGDQEVAVTFQPPGSQRVRAVIGLWEGERPAAYPVEAWSGWSTTPTTRAPSTWTGTCWGSGTWSTVPSPP